MCSAGATTWAWYDVLWHYITILTALQQLFRESKAGATNGQFSNINFDNVDVGLALYSSQLYGLMFSNLNIANAVRYSTHTT